MFLLLLIVTVFYPLLKRKPSNISAEVHEVNQLSLAQLKLPPSYQRVAIALDFSKRDAQLLAHAIGQSKENAELFLIHIVESVSANMLESESDDLETRTDQQHIDFYANRFKQMGYEATGILGFNRRSKEIVRIIKEEKADMLVIGAHGHTGIKDWFYGQTINTVRHELNIPVLVVNV